MVRDELLEYDVRKQKNIQEILIWIRQKRYKFDNFTFIHLALFNATEKIRQDKDSLFIYHIFYQELHHFEEHTHFNIYLYHRINTLKRSLSTEHIQRKFNIQDKEKIVNNQAST